MMLDGKDVFFLAWVVCFPGHAVKAGHREQSRMANVVLSVGAEPDYGVFAV